MNNIQTEILTDIRSVRQSIKVAVSWLTDNLLINELLAARQRGVEVKIIVSANKLNIIRFELFQKLIDKGATVNKEGSEEPEQGGFMHYKFYIIDDRFAKSGSYNWSVNALTNREALDDVSVSKKLNEFNDCFKKSVNFFLDIVNPEQKRAELQLIEKQQKDVLTPEKLAAYRQTQIAIKEQEARHKNEIKAKVLETKQDPVTKALSYHILVAGKLFYIADSAHISVKGDIMTIDRTKFKGHHKLTKKDNFTYSILLEETPLALEQAEENAYLAKTKILSSE